MHHRVALHEITILLIINILHAAPLQSLFHYKLTCWYESVNVLNLTDRCCVLSMFNHDWPFNLSVKGHSHLLPPGVPEHLLSLHLHIFNIPSITINNAFKAFPTHSLCDLASPHTAQVHTTTARCRGNHYLNILRCFPPPAGQVCSGTFSRGGNSETGLICCVRIAPLGFA